MAGREAGSLVRASPVIDQYEVLELMVEGGRENVFKARRRKDDRLVVLKEILDPIGNRIELAIEIHDRLQSGQHTPLVPLLATFEYEGGSVQVLEYLPRARTLADVLRSGRSRARRMMAGIMLGLQAKLLRRRKPVIKLGRTKV